MKRLADLRSAVERQLQKDSPEQPGLLGDFEVVPGDLNRDGLQDYVVFYSVEGQDGGNHYETYLTALLQKKSGGTTQLVTVDAEPFQLPRFYTPKRVVNGIVVIEALAYLGDEKPELTYIMPIKGSWQWVSANGNQLE